MLAFRLAWIVNHELDLYDALRVKRREQPVSQTIAMKRAMQGNVRAPNGFETYPQMLARKQLQADTYGWS
jgi:hypothetical protein